MLLSTISEMNNLENESFVIPDGFTEEQIEGQLHVEDLDEDDEIWLIRMSSDVELSVLDRKKIWLSDLPGEVNVKDIKTENGKLLECYSENCEIPNLSVILPQKSDKKLHAVKKVIKGTILISEGLSVGENIEIKSESQNEEKVNGANFSSESKRKKEKKRKNACDFDNNNLNYETDDVESAVSFNRYDRCVKKHSDVRKKHNSEKVDVKAESLSMDMDAFPLCVSQK